MKSIELIETAEARIKALRADLEEREFTKSMIADAFSTLAELVQYSKNKDSDIPQFVDEILDVMYVIARHNKLINDLSATYEEDVFGKYELIKEGGMS